MKIKCIIIDDEYLARKLLADYVSKLPNLELVAVCSNATEAMDILRNNTVDLMFLDIQMPDLTGIEFVKSLDNKPIVVFTTAYSEYAIDGFELNAIDYLLKPISFERFFKAANKASTQIKLLTNNANSTAKSYITIKSEHRIHKVDYDNITHIEGLKEYVIFHLKEGKRIITLEALKKLELILPNNFLRVHRSNIINKDFVKSLYGNMIEIEDQKISIGKTYKDIVLKELF